MKISPDFRDLLTAFADSGVRYLVVGGYAVSFHHRPRTTKDLDLWIDGSDENLERTAKALAVFGAPPGLIAEVRSMKPTEIVYFGKPPLRVDLIRSLAGLDFDTAFDQRVEATWDDVPVNIIGKAELIASKRAAGRPQDREDLRGLRRSKRKR
jgi:hypothetical protein